MVNILPLHPLQRGTTGGYPPPSPPPEGDSASGE